MTVAIVGNGILGLMAAWELGRRDPDTPIVIVGDPARVGSASLAAGAMLHAFCELERGALDEPTRRARFELCRAASARWPAVLRELSETSERAVAHGHGSLLLETPDATGAANFAAMEDALKRFGEPYSHLAASQLAKRGLSCDVRALFVEREGWVDAPAVLIALQTVLERQPQVRFVPQDCTRLDFTGGRMRAVMFADGRRLPTGRVLVCNGAGFSPLMRASGLGECFPEVRAATGVSLRVQMPAPAQCLRTPVRGPGVTVYVVPRSATEFSLGATFRLDQRPGTEPQAQEITKLLDASRELLGLPIPATAVRQAQVGWRPVTDDGLPLIGATSIPGLFVATGTRRDGFHCAPQIATLCADGILGDAGSWDPAFYPERHTGLQAPLQVSA